MSESSLPRMLLRSAKNDAVACLRLAPDPSIHDSIVGFHAQQAVEKSLKAVLAHDRVTFRHTHDVVELLDALNDNDIVAPPHAGRLDELNPYAVAARYGLFEPSGLDRAEAVRWVDEIVAWAEAQLDRPGRSTAGP
jgi:HEPN domain-containing protein